LGDISSLPNTRRPWFFALPVNASIKTFFAESKLFPEEEGVDDDEEEEEELVVFHLHLGRVKSGGRNRDM
jgi:hypothetical protein